MQEREGLFVAEPFPSAPGRVFLGTGHLVQRGHGHRALFSVAWGAEV